MRVGLLAIFALGAGLLFGGCFSPDYGSGHLQCASGGGCPSGFHCAQNNRCYRDGDNPDVGVANDGGAVDLSSTDLAQGNVDLYSPPNLTPVITLAPPAAAWTCGGGSSGTASSGSQLNISIGGAIVTGTAIAPSGATATFGYFSSDTY